MFSVTIQLREIDGQLAISIEPSSNSFADCTDVERGAALVLKQHVDAALSDIITGRRMLLDMEGEGENVLSWHRRLFG
jgi:hypothetical protein